MPEPNKQGAALLELDQVQKSFGGTHALKGVSLKIHCGEALGLAGENGAGKSTLLNILGGVHEPTFGSIRWEGRLYQPSSPREADKAGLAFIHQELNLFPNLTIAENILAPRMPVRSIGGLRIIDKQRAYHDANEALEQVGLKRHPSTPVAQLSAGERQMVEIAKAIRQEAKLILFDEPTTSLSHREKDCLFTLIGELRSRGIAMIYISHALGDLFQLCDRIAVLRDGALVGEGSVAELSQRKLVSMMIGRDQSQAFPNRSAKATTRVILSARDFRSARMPFPLSLVLRQGEVVGLAGLMGAGRSELLRALFGLDKPLQGSLICDGEDVTKAPPRSRIKSGMAMLTESRRDDGLFLPASISANMLMPSLKQVSRTPLQFLRRGALNRLAEDTSKQITLDRSARLEQPVEQLSGGNQQKVIMGRWLLRRPRVFLMDEPTRGVDVGAKFEIYTLIDQLAASGAAVLVASSEIDELMGICSRILVMRKGAVVKEFQQPDFNNEAILEAAIMG